MRGGQRGRGARRGGLEQSTRLSAGAAVVACSPGGVGATASVKAPRRVTSTPARVVISHPRSARLAPPWQKGPSPHVGWPRFGMTAASCAEPTAARGASPVSHTR
jgi:hypothetical protein